MEKTVEERYAKEFNSRAKVEAEKKQREEMPNVVSCKITEDERYFILTTVYRS